MFSLKRAVQKGIDYIFLINADLQPDIIIFKRAYPKTCVKNSKKNIQINLLLHLKSKPFIPVNIDKMSV